jgi:hypothetical protein
MKGVSGQLQKRPFSGAILPPLLAQASPLRRDTNPYYITCEVHIFTNTQKHERFTALVFPVAIIISPFFKSVENLAWVTSRVG